MKLILAEFPDGKALIGDDQGNTSIVSSRLAAILGPLNRFLADRIDPWLVLKKRVVDGPWVAAPIYQEEWFRTEPRMSVIEPMTETFIETEMVTLQTMAYRVSRRRSFEIPLGYGARSKTWYTGTVTVRDSPNPDYQTHPHLEPYVPEICQALGCYYRLDVMNMGFTQYQLSHDNGEYLQITDVLTTTPYAMFREATTRLARRAHPDAA